MERGGTRRPAPGALVVGGDLGATKLRLALVDPRGRVVARSDRILLTSRRPSSVAAAVTRGVAALTEASGSAPVALGLAVAAQVDPASGSVRYAPNLRWRDLPFGRTLERSLGIPVTLENDARAATWGEWRHGAGRGARDLFVLIVGTGVGGGAVVDGRGSAGPRMRPARSVT
jgi:glucokinase